MAPVQTLHEFALNLLSDPQALADFNTDPQGLLNAAGLADVSAADVQEIIPLVTETALPAPLGVYDATAETLGGLPDLSGVFGAVSDVAEQTGLNTAAQGTLDTVSTVVDGVADGVQGVPVVGPLVEAGAIDLQNTVAAVGEHLFDGQLVGASVDALTNHLGDALLPAALVDTVSGLPGVGEPLGELVDGVRYEAGAVIGTVNDAIGSTPVGVPSGQELADAYSEALGGVTDVTGSVSNVTGLVTDHVGDVPVVGDVVSGLVDTASGVLGGGTGLDIGNLTNGVGLPDTASGLLGDNGLHLLH